MACSLIVFGPSPSATKFGTNGRAGLSSNYLLRRGKRWYVRIHIPVPLRPFFGGKRELRQSLKTTVYTTAKSLLPGHLYRTDKLFAKLRAAMTDEEIRQLVSEYLKGVLERDAAGEGFCIFTPRGADPLEAGEAHAEALGVREGLLDDHRENLALWRYKGVQHVADWILEDAGISLPANDPARTKLCHELLRGIVEVEEVGIARMHGNWMNAFDAQHSYLKRLRGADPVPAETQPAPPDEGEPLSKLIADFVQEGSTSGRWKGRTNGEAAGVLGAFLRIVGDRGVKTLDRRVLTSFRDTLIRWPANINKKVRYRGKTVPEILAMGADSPLSTTSVNKHLTYTQGFVRWCVASGYLGTNVAANLTISKRNVKASSERQPYDTSDLQRLLSSPIYTTPPKDHPEKWWIPLICLFSGCRLGEATQLHVSDIRTVDGIPCFDLNAVGDKNLKTASSARTVPIHSSLLELGLLAHVEKLKKEGKPRLWMDLKLKREGYGQDVGRWFQRYGRKHISADKRKSLHSFRHTFITALNRAHVPEAVVAELAGHAHGNIDRDRYGHGFEAGQLREAIEKLDFGITEELKKLKRLPL